MPKTMMIPFAFVALISAQPALAYVGPGSGLGAVGIVFGLIGTLFLTLISFVWYPLKRLYRKIRRQIPRRPRTSVMWRGKSAP